MSRVSNNGRETPEIFGSDDISTQSIVRQRNLSAC